MQGGFVDGTDFTNRREAAKIGRQNNKFALWAAIILIILVGAFWGGDAEFGPLRLILPIIRRVLTWC